MLNFSGLTIEPIVFICINPCSKTAHKKFLDSKKLFLSQREKKMFQGYLLAVGVQVSLPVLYTYSPKKLCILFVPFDGVDGPGLLFWMRPRIVAE